MAKLIASQKRKREKGGGTFAHEMRGDRGTSEQLFQGRIGSVPTRGGKGREKLFLSCKSGEALEGGGRGKALSAPMFLSQLFFFEWWGGGGRTKRGRERKPSAPKWGGKLRERRREWGKGEKTHGRSREQEEEEE